MPHGSKIPGSATETYCMLGMEGKDGNKLPCELRFQYLFELTLSCRSNFCKPRKRKSILQNPCIMESAPTVLKISRPDSWYSLAMMNPKTMMTGLSTQARTKRAWTGTKYMSAFLNPSNIYIVTQCWILFELSRINNSSLINWPINEHRLIYVWNITNMA